MIAVVNPNVGLDYVLFFEGFAQNSVIRAGKASWGLGGKGLVAAYLLAGIGEEVWVTGFSGGVTGKKVEEILRSKGAETDFVTAAGTARLNVVLVETGERWETTITAPGVEVNFENVESLLAKVERSLEGAGSLILGGSLPPGCPVSLYRDLIALARKKGAPCVVDTSGQALIEATGAHPTAVKPNHHEAAALAGRPIGSVDDALALARRIQEEGIPWVVISLGREGIVATDGNRERWVPPPPVSPRSTAGAGDALTAGLALGLAKGWELQESIRWGLALAATLMEAGSVLECDFGKVGVWLSRVGKA